MEAEQSHMSILSSCFIKEGDLVTRCIAGETIIVAVWAHMAELDSIYTLWMASQSHALHWVATSL